MTSSARQTPASGCWGGGDVHMLTCCDGPLICIITGSFTKSQPSHYLGFHSLQHSSPYKPLPSPGCYVLSKTNKQNKTAEYYTDDFSEQMTLMDKETDRQTDRSERGTPVGRMQPGLSFSQDPALCPLISTKRTTKSILLVTCATGDGVPGAVDRGLVSLLN